jgi:hypothetical protein
MSRKLQDLFFKQAKKEGYLARSAYKLLEIQKEYRVISGGKHPTLPPTFKTAEEIQTSDQLFTVETASEGCSGKNPTPRR